MKNWRFLIQQEGDRDWLPLDSPESEILEGRYRLVGQSPLPHHPVQIDLIYRDLDTAAVRHRSRKTQTNSTGLVGIFPFSRLQPGLWEVLCQIDTDSVTLRLRVDPQDGGPELESEPDLSRLASAYGNAQYVNAGRKVDSKDSPISPRQADAPALSQPRSPAPVNPAAPDEAMASVADLFQTVEAMADQVINRLSEELAADKPPIREAPSRSPSTATHPATATIQLQSSAYSVQVNHPLTLEGHILGPRDFVGLPGTLTLMLITSRTGETVAQQTYPGQIGQLPYAFKWTVPVSLTNETQLMLARLSLRSNANPDQLWPLVECSFAVMILPSEGEAASQDAHIAASPAGLPLPSMPPPASPPVSTDSQDPIDDIVNPFQYPE
ncbi:MAG: hypothetical protein WBA10_15250 [Elainellaceae cyanobacterium]